MNWRVPLADVVFDAAEERAVLDVLRRGWLTMGSETQQFETAFGALVASPYAFAVTNCTAALHLACLALEIGPGDEVIVPSLTFVATANALRYVGATPIFADISGQQDFSVDPDDVAAKITPRTKAIIVVHYAGYACDMPRISQIARDHDLFVIEDVAHAPGASLDGRPLGSWGDIGCFSFFSNKNLVTGEGGMLTTSSEVLAERIKLLRSHGMTTLTWDRYQGHAFSYDVVVSGYNFRIDEMRAAIGRVQLEKLAHANSLRRAHNAQYVALLSEIVPEICVPYANHGGLNACHIRPVLLPPSVNRHHFMQKMRQRGIQTSIHYPPVHQFTAYRHVDVTLPKTEFVGQHEVTLPLYPTMSEEDVALVVAEIRSVLDL